MNFFDDDFGLGSIPNLNRNSSFNSIQQIKIYLEKEMLILIKCQKNLPEKINLMIYLMICSQKNRKRIIRRNKNSIYNLSVVLIQNPILSVMETTLKKLINGVLLIFNRMLLQVFKEIKNNQLKIEVVRMQKVTKADLQANQINLNLIIW